MCPGRARSTGLVAGSMSAFMVAARSAAEIPVVVPGRKSTVTVNAVRCDSVLCETISGSSSSSSRSGSSGTQMRPEVNARKKAMFSGVANSAARMRSPSFSRFSSSTTTTMPPRPIASMASSIVDNPICQLLVGSSLPAGQPRLIRRRRFANPCHAPARSGATTTFTSLPSRSTDTSRPLHASAIVAAPLPANTGRPSSPPSMAGAR